MDHTSKRGGGSTDNERCSHPFTPYYLKIRTDDKTHPGPRRGAPEKTTRCTLTVAVVQPFLLNPVATVRVAVPLRRHTRRIPRSWSSIWDCGTKGARQHGRKCRVRLARPRRTLVEFLRSEAVSLKTGDRARVTLLRKPSFPSSFETLCRRFVVFHLLLVAIHHIT